jgi:hypothetical protein
VCIPESILAPLRSLDWSDLQRLEPVCRSALHAINRANCLRDALAGVPDDKRLWSLCEHYDILDKIVLHDDPSGFRIRLHVFGPDYFDRPHNHRWVYGSLILSGRYVHTLFSLEEPVGNLERLPSLVPLMTRVERQGDCYVVGTEAIHTVTADPFTVTLVLRGPAIKDRFFVMDRETGRAWWQFGTKQETEAERNAKVMTTKMFTTLSKKLVQASIV